MKLFWTIVVDYSTSGYVGFRFPRILGGILSVLTFALNVFAAFGVLVVLRAVKSEENDFIDDELFGFVIVVDVPTVPGIRGVLLRPIILNDVFVS